MREKILVVEDDLALKPLWESIARRNFGPGSLDWAVSGEEGRKIYLSSIQKKGPYTLVATDVFLAGSETGLDFARYVRSLGQGTPILLMSVLPEQSLRESLEEGLNPIVVLEKPLNVLKCERVLEQFARTHPLRPMEG